MSNDLTKRAKDWEKTQAEATDELHPTLKAMAAEIDGNTKTLGYALKTCQNLDSICRTSSERIDLLREEIEKLKAELKYCQRIKPGK